MAKVPVQEVLGAVRQDHPELAKAQDGEILQALYQDGHFKPEDLDFVSGDTGTPSSGPGFLNSLKTGLGLEHAEGVTPFDTANKLVAAGLEKTGQLAAKAGWAGAPIGVPALMGREFLESETMGGRVAQGLAVGAPLLNGAISAPLEGGMATGALKTTAKTMANVPERDTQTVINALNEGRNPFARSVDDITQDYVSKIPGLKSATDVIRDTGEVAPKVGDFNKLANDSKANIISKLTSAQRGAPIDAKDVSQDSLNLIQSINQMLGNKEFRSGAVVRGLMDDRASAVDLMDKLNPGFADVNRELREAHAAQSLQSWTPLNKNGSPNALRGFLSTGNLLTSLGTGNPLLIAQALGMKALTTPKAYGAMLRGASALTSPVGVDLSGLMSGLTGAGSSGATSVAASFPRLTTNAVTTEP